MIEEIVKRGPGRPRKTETGTTSEEHSMTPEITIAAPKEEPKQDAAKLYTFKLLKGANFPNPDFKVVDVDDEGKWLEQRDPVQGLEYGPHSKVWPGTIVAVNAEKAKWMKANKVAVDVVNYE